MKSCFSFFSMPVWQAPPPSAPTMRLLFAPCTASISLTGWKPETRQAGRNCSAKLTLCPIAGASLEDRQRRRRPSYLFGTIHLSDPRVLTLPKAADEAYRSASTVVIETTDILDPKAFLRLKLEQPDLLLFTDGSTLKSHIPPERRAEIEQKLAERGIVLDAVAKMKPWVLTSLLALPKCERERKSEGEKSLDERLALDAQAEGRNVLGLESATEQLVAMNRMPLDFHLRNLVATVDYGDKVEDAMETTTALYLKGEIGLIMPSLRKIVPDSLSEEDYELFLKYLISDRNQVMADRAVPIIDKGNTFIAVGALHLPGKDGIIELLRAKGYRVTPL